MFAFAKARVELTAGEKQKDADIHNGMIPKYKKWADLLLTEDGLVIGKKPDYLTEAMLKTVDVAQKKFFEGHKDGKQMWSKWHQVKKDVLNRDNLAVAKAIALMPNVALPSGTDFSLFLDCIIYFKCLCINMYLLYE